MCSNFISDVRSAFSGELSDTELFVFDSIGSTNDEARNFALSGSDKNAIFIAREQTSGRGRRGRSFISREGGLYISYLLHPRLSVRDSVMLTVFAAVALSEVIEEMTESKPGIKWVNDVFLGGKKLAGILAEGGFSPDGELFDYAVVGIGVNLHGASVPPEIEGIATTLEAESHTRVDISEFAVRLAKKLSKFEDNLSRSYMEDYRKRCFIVGKRVKMTSAGEEFFAKILGIENDGALRIVLDSGEEKILYSAEVSVVL